EHVELTSPTVTSPVAMRFAWNEIAMPNLVNGAGLVTSAFRAGEVKPPLFTEDPINEIDAIAGAAYSSSIADDAFDPGGRPMTFSKESGPAWLNVALDGTLSGIPSDSDIGDNVFTVQVDVEDGSDTATLNISVIKAIVRWGQAGGDTEILTAGTNTAGQNPFPAVYNPATLVNPADGTNGYNVNAVGRTNEFSGAFSNTNTVPVFVNNAAGDYMQLVYNGDFTSSPFETMVVWDSSKFLPGGSGLGAMTVEFKERSGSNVPTVSFVVETSAGWYVTDQTDTQDGSTYKSFILDAASATFSGFNKFGVTAGSGPPDLSDIQSVGVFSSTTSTVIGWTGTFLRYIQFAANQPPSFTSDPINELSAFEGAAYGSSIADDASDPESDPMTFSKVSGRAWLSVAPNGDLSGTPGAGDVGVNAFTVQVDALGGSHTATLNITVNAAGPSFDIVKWGQAGGDTEILTAGTNTAGQNPFPAVYDPAALVNPADGTNGYDVNAAGRTNEFSGAYSNTNTTPVFVNNAAGDYMQLVYNGDFTAAPFETMVVWDSSEFLAQGSSSPLEELSVEFREKSSSNVPTVSFVVETSAGWYVTDQTDTTDQTYKSFILDAATATFSGFNKFGLTAGSGQPDLSDIQSVGVLSSTTNTAVGWTGTFIRYVNVVASGGSNQDLLGDLTGDGIVNMEDIAELGKLWLNPHDINTLLQIANNWLYGTSP
ncbi:MAG: hypothetical protein OEV87_11635, partial [Phycisphaerae bacterium]|nr:hypothetical protein [Phycisphaerae bacterium]